MQSPSGECTATVRRYDALLGAGLRMQLVSWPLGPEQDLNASTTSSDDRRTRTAFVARLREFRWRAGGPHPWGPPTKGVRRHG